MGRYDNYLKIKDKICIIYSGYNTEYIIQFKLLIPDLTIKLNNIDITFCCRSNYLDLLEPYQNKISLEQHRNSDYGITFPMVYDASKEIHPIFSLLKDKKLTKYKVTGSKSYNGLICPEGNFPTKSVSRNQLSILKNLVLQRGFKPMIIGTGSSETDLPIDKRPNNKEKLELARNAGYVIGVECDVLYEALGAGIPTTLIGNSEIYKLICENPNFFNIS